MKKEDIPNAITALRLVLAFMLFVILSLYLACRTGAGGALGPSVYDDSALGLFFREHGRALLNLCFVLFVAGAVSDILDGMLARRWEVVSVFGRIADPFADKVMIAGTFVLMVPLGQEVVGIAPWMVVAILAREQLVTTMRGYAESQGLEFSASIWGKMKMVLQSICGGALLLWLANGPVAEPAFSLVRALVWFTLAVTVFSGGLYIQRARELFAEAARVAAASSVVAGGESA